jgi:hypothetical protein
VLLAARGHACADGRDRSEVSCYIHSGGLIDPQTAR